MYYYVMKGDSMKKKLLHLVITVLILSTSLGALLSANEETSNPYDGNGTTLLERPSSGSPKDYSALDNIAIASWVVKHAESFESHTEGAVDASIEWPMLPL